MNDQIDPQSTDEFRKIGRQTLYKAIAGGLIAGVVAAGGVLWGYVSNIAGPLGLVPDGAVVAFDIEKGCPRGWKNISEIDRERFAGRVIVAVGPRVDRINSKTTLLREFNDRGGQETVVLTEAQMPMHNHNLTTSLNGQGFQAGGKNYPVPTSANLPAFPFNGYKGEGGAHINMPPYIALYYCKKN